MKPPIFAAGCVGIWLIVAAFVGCSTTAQRTTFNTIGGIEAAADSSVDGYFHAVIVGQVSTNGVPTVTKAFNDLQASLTLAAAADAAGTNGLAASSLQTEFADLLNLIATLKK